METGISFYQSIADNYLTKDPYRLKYHDNRFRTFNRLLPEKPSRILDFGCGSAENVVNMIRMGHDVTGVDPVERLVEIGRSNLSQAGLPDTLHTGDVSRLGEFETGSFDVVGALSVLSYLNAGETAEFFKQAARLVAPGGTAVLSFSNLLVDLVTFNRFTVEFWKREIIPNLTDDETVQAEMLEGFKSRLAFPDEPESRHSEIDKVVRNRRNPHLIGDEMKAHGFTLDAMKFMHWLPLPPQWLEGSRYAHVKYDNRLPHWMGYTHASMFVVRATQ